MRGSEHPAEIKSKTTFHRFLPTHCVFSIGSILKVTRAILKNVCCLSTRLARCRSFKKTVLLTEMSALAVKVSNKRAVNRPYRNKRPQSRAEKISSSTNRICSRPPNLGTRRRETVLPNCGPFLLALSFVIPAISNLLPTWGQPVPDSRSKSRRSRPTYRTLCTPEESSTSAESDSVRGQHLLLLCRSSPKKFPNPCHPRGNGTAAWLPTEGRRMAVLYLSALGRAVVVGSCGGNRNEPGCEMPTRISSGSNDAKEPVVRKRGLASALRGQPALAIRELG